MFIVMLRFSAQSLLILTALALLLWHGFFGAGWIAAFVYATFLTFLANLIGPTPDEQEDLNEFCAQRRAKE